MACGGITTDGMVGAGGSPLGLASSGGAPPGKGSGGNSASGGSVALGGPVGGGQSCSSSEIFDGVGIRAEGCNFARLQGTFYVIQDGAPLGQLLNDGLSHTLLHVDGTNGELMFGSQSPAPCVSGTLARVTDSRGGVCDPAGTDCEWTRLWGGGIGLRFTQPEGAFDAAAAKVQGIHFELSGTTGGAPIQFLVADTAHPEEAFCVEVAPSGFSNVDLSTLKHQCGGGPLQLDVTKLTDMRWRLVNDSFGSHGIQGFCVKNVALY